MLDGRGGSLGGWMQSSSMASLAESGRVSNVREVRLPTVNIYSGGGRVHQRRRRSSSPCSSSRKCVRLRVYLHQVVQSNVTRIRPRLLLLMMNLASAFEGHAAPFHARLPAAQYSVMLSRTSSTFTAKTACKAESAGSPRKRGDCWRSAFPNPNLFEAEGWQEDDQTTHECAVGHRGSDGLGVYAGSR